MNISRHKPAVQLGVAGLLLLSFLLASVPASGATPRAPAIPTRGVVTLTDWQFPDGCNQLATSSVANVEICAPMQDSLFKIDDKLNYRPNLAERIPTTKNGGARVVNGNLVVSYKLKPNLRWSDGSPLTSDDVIFSVRLGIATGNTFGVDQIKEMKRIDARTVQVTYKGVYAPYVAYGNPQPLWPQKYLQKKYGTRDVTAIGQRFLNDAYNSADDVWSGPYKVQSWINGQSVVLVPNPYYSAMPPARGKPRVAQIRFVNISHNAAALTAALQSRNVGVDKAEDLQFNDLPALYSTPYRVTVQPALTVEHLELNQAGPLKDVRLRQALQYAVDKRELFKQLFPAVKSPDDFMLRTVLPNASPWQDKDAPLSEYNPNKARALVRAAGYTDQYNGPGKRLTLRFATTEAPARQKAFQILSRYWAEVGIHVVPTFYSGSPAANNGMFSAYNRNGILIQRRFDVALFAFSESPDPQQQETSFNPKLIPSATQQGASNQNYTGITDKDQFALLERARRGLDTAERRAVFNQWQRLVNERVYFIMLYARSNITVDNGKIGNYKPNPSQEGNSWNAYEWYYRG